jgi:plastocyanin
VKRPILSLSLLLILVLTWPTQAGDSTKATTHTVTIRGFEFVPKELTVHLGDTIVWTNEDIVPHTATSKGAFDSNEIAPEKSWTYKSIRKGRFSYICAYHPTMSGALTVE